MCFPCLTDILLAKDNEINSRFYLSSTVMFFIIENNYFTYFIAVLIKIKASFDPTLQASRVFSSNGNDFLFPTFDPCESTNYMRPQAQRLL